jgi:hypothetical protein
MNLREIKDLTRKLSELIQKDLHKAQESKLAGDYEGACKDANKRLVQCSQMLEEGNMPGAVQLANVNPPLMEFIRALTWEDAGIWREHCNTKSLPSPPIFEGQAIKSLTRALVNEDTIGPEHLLSKEFSSLTIKKRPEEAYRVLCIILEKDPNNQSYTSIRPQLEQYIIEQKTKVLAQAVAKNDTPEVLALMREIEDFTFANLPEIEIWPQAKTLECYAWIAGVDECRQTNNWLGAQERIQNIDQARIEFPSCKITPEYEQYLNGMRSWVQQEEMAWLTQLNLNEAVRDLEVFLGNRENDRLMHRNVKYRDLLTLQYELGTLWNDLQSLDQAIPDSLVRRFHEEEDALDYDIERALVARKWTYITATAASVVLCAFLAVCLMNFNKAKALMANLKQYQEDRKVQLVESALSDIDSVKLKKLITPDFKESLAKARLFVKQEKDRLTQVTKDLAELDKLKASNFEGLALDNVFSLENTEKKLVKTAELVANLPPDNVKTNDTQLIMFTNSWQAFLAPEHKIRQDQLKAILLKMRNNGTNLVLSSGPEIVEKGVLAFDALMIEWNKTSSIKVTYLQPTSAQLYELGLLKDSKGQIQAHLVEWKKSNTKLSDASILNDLVKYHAALDEIAANDITSSTSKKAISIIKSKNLNQKRIVTDLLAPDNLKAHDDFPKLIDSFSLRPKTIKDPDFITKYDSIVNNKFNAQFDLKIIDLLDHKTRVRLGFHEVYVMKPAKLKIRTPQKINMYYPELTGGVMKFEMQCPFRLGFIEIDINGKTHKYTPVVNDDDSLRLNHNTIVSETNLDNLWDGAADKKMWVGDILDCLDRLNKRMVSNGHAGEHFQRKFNATKQTNYPVGNAMLGAYLLYNLLELIKTDPEDWGMVWCPLAYEHIQKLEGLKIDSMRDQDWLAPIKKKTFNPELGIDKFFCEALGLNFSTMPLGGFNLNQVPFGYIQEAKAYHNLVASAYGKGTGVVVVGHADPLVKDVGRWVTKPQPGAMEIWGYTEGGPPEIVATSLNGFVFKRTKHKVLDYSPLFILTGDRKKLFKQFTIENNGRLIKGLPKAFSDLQLSTPLP